MIRLFRKTSYPSLTDEELMHRLSETQDEKAFNELYERHARRLMGFFIRTFGYDEETASDACQEIFMKVWQTATGFNSKSSFQPWFYTIAYNYARSKFRHSEQEQRYFSEQTTTATESYEDTSELQLDNATLLKALETTLQTLSAESRTLFALRFEEELSIRQVAQVLNLPEGTVKSKVHRLLGHLKRQLHHYE